MTGAIAKREEAPALLTVEKAAQMLAECTRVDEAKDIHDKAAAFKVYLRKQRAALEAQNQAAEIQLLAARRAGELLEEQKARGARAQRGDNLARGRAAPKAYAEPSARPPTLDELGIERNAAQRMRTLAKVPEAKFSEIVRVQKQRGELTTAGVIKAATSKNPHAAGNVGDADEKNNRFTPRDLLAELHQEFGFTVDAAGHPDAPATEIIGRIWTVHDDGLEQSWDDEVPFWNPPFNDLPDWVEKAHNEAERGCRRSVGLMPSVRTEQPFWQAFIEPYRPDRGGSGVRVRFLDRRRSYGNPSDPEGKGSGSPGWGTAIVIFEGERIRSPEFPPLDEAGAAAAEPRASTAPLGSLLSRDRFEGEAEDLNFSTMLTKHQGKTVIAARCRSKRCSTPSGAVIHLPVTSEMLIRRAELAVLRVHRQNDDGKGPGSARAGKGGKRR